jgi:hypothetical protein
MRSFVPLFLLGCVALPGAALAQRDFSQTEI